MAERIGQIKQRLRYITPGKWRQGGRDKNVGSQLSVIVETDDAYMSIASTGGYANNKEDVQQRRMWQVADADFIAHAPEDVAYLLEEVERLQSANKRLRDALKDVGCEST